MDTAELRTFLAVVEQESFSDAARSLNISQPTVSAHIRKLENELKASLFVRSNRKLHLTELARELKEHAQRVVRELQATELAMRENIETQSRTLKVAHTPSHRDVTLAVASAIMEERPQVRILLEEMLERELENALLDYRFDLGVRGYVDSSPERDCGLSYERLSDALPFRLVANLTHPLARAKSKPSFDEISQQRFALIRGGQHREAIDAYFRSMHSRPVVVAEASTVRDILSLLRERPEIITIIAMPTPHLTDLRDLFSLEIDGAPKQKSVLLWPGSERKKEAARAFGSKLHAYFDDAASLRAGRPAPVTRSFPVFVGFRR